MRAPKLLFRVIPAFVGVLILASSPLFAAHIEAPAWMHALVNAPLPPHDEKDDAVMLYSEENLTVSSVDKFHTVVRKAYKILRPEGRELGDLELSYDSLSEKITSIHAWCIPATGKDYEVTDKDATEFGPQKTSIVMTSAREKVLHIPAPDPGNIIGFEYVSDSHPYVLQDIWYFQHPWPVREAHYSLNLPPGWEFKVGWINYPEVKVQEAGAGVWQWTVGNLKDIRGEEKMPPWRAVAGHMIVDLFPPGGSAKSPPTWSDLGRWYTRLTSDRLASSPEVKQQVATLTASLPTTVAKMRSLADYIQQNIRYVGIELGIGGFQPHAAADVFEHRYGDCKDKATLMQSMLHEIGVESYYVLIHTRRGSVTPGMLPYYASFNHAIIAIKLPDGVADPSLVATIKHPTLGTLLIFDPTNEKTPFGEIGGYLQSNYGLLIAPGGGELVELPQLASASNGVRRTGKLTLTFDGTLRGDVDEVRVGDVARRDRYAYISAEKVTDQIKPVEELLSDSLATFHIAKADAAHVKETNSPFVWDYSFQSENYAKYAGNLLLVRPRVLGKKAWGLLETSEPRRYPIEFDGPEKDTDDFEITLPPHYVVDDLPPAVDADFGFASYHSKTEIAGNVLRYHRTYEVKELSVPLNEAADLKKFYRIISSDERNTAVLKLAQ